MLTDNERQDLIRATAGQSACYVYFKDRIEDRVKRLREALTDRVGLLYSVKANPHPEVLAKMRSLGLGADVASEHELTSSLDSGFDPRLLSFVGPGKRNKELETAVKRNIGLIVVESVTEAVRLNKIGSGQDVLVRVNPSSYISPGGRSISKNPIQFGIDEQALPEALKEIRQMKSLRVRGLHFFSGSQHLDAERIVQNFEAALALSLRVNPAFDVLDLGGGFGVPYFAGQKELDLSELRARMQTFLSKAPTSMRLLAESGRYLVASAGFYVAQIIDQKVSNGIHYWVLSGGMNHNFALTGFGQAVRRNFKVGVLAHMNEAQEKVTLVGPTCYSLDVLAQDIQLPKQSIGDWVYFENGGAYGPSFSPLGFLSHPLPGEIFI